MRFLSETFLGAKGEKEQIEHVLMIERECCCLCNYFWKARDEEDVAVVVKIPNILAWIILLVVYRLTIFITS